MQFLKFKVIVVKKYTCKKVKIKNKTLRKLKAIFHGNSFGAFYHYT